MRARILVGAVGLALLATAAPAGADFLDPANPCPPGITVTPAPFADRDQVPDSHKGNVDCAAALGIVKGKGGTPNNLEPAGSTRRDQMASLVLRALQAAGYTVPAAGDQGFTDLAGNVHRDAVNRLAAIDVVRGQTATSYNPAGLVRRDQMASFAVRAASFAFDSDFEAVEGPHFGDVPGNSVHRPAIDAAFEVLGLLEGTSAGVYNPDGFVRRDQMSTIMVRLVDISLVTA